MRLEGDLPSRSLWKPYLTAAAGYADFGVSADWLLPALMAHADHRAREMHRKN